MMGVVPSVWALGLLCILHTSAFQPPSSSVRHQANRHKKPVLQVVKEDPHLEEDALLLKNHRLTSQADSLLQIARGSASKPETSRRLAFASALMAAGTLLGADEVRADNLVATGAAELPVLTWKASPINKRSGVTLFDAERSGYNIQFITYLARFLLSFDGACQGWWFSLDLPRTGSAEEINEIRLEQFGAFAASVEVGLQDFQGPDGPKKLMKSMLLRYCPEIGPKADSDSEKKKQKRREIKEAKRQIALLFSLLKDAQPVQEITALLAAISNGSINSVKMASDVVLGGYGLGDEPPTIEFPAPEAGDNYDAATGRAILEPTGTLLRIDIYDRGSGYKTAPPVTITPPEQEGGKAASAKVKLFSNGPNKGSIESVELLDPGSGYCKDEIIQVEVPPPAGELDQVAILRPVPELRVDRIEVINPGCGYAVEKPLKVYINSTVAGSGTKRVVAGVAYPEAEKSSYTRFRRDSDITQVLEFEEKLDKLYDITDKKSVIGSDSGIENNIPLLPLWGGKSTSSKLLRLLPNGVGLEYDTKLKRYVLAVDTNLKDSPSWLQQSSKRPLDPEFGPRGRSPLERQMNLGLSTYLRFCASGAICASGVHLALTPLDVVKTKVQTNPDKYPTVGASFRRVFEEEGLSTFFTGWVPTFLGNFFSGAVLYAITEVIRRYLTEAAGSDAASLEVPIILAAAGTASFVGSFLSCPFEAVRIRTVAQPDFAPNFPGVVARIYEEEGLFGGFLNAIPVFLVKNIPYAMVKFTVFDISTERLYEAYPAANEDIKLSLLISLVGGILGGTAAAIISNPADAVISEMKKAKSDMGPQDALAVMLERAGVGALLKGLPLRMVFYSMVASLQFLVYDTVRFALGIGPDDLKLYLDVLGGALNQNSGPL